MDRPYQRRAARAAAKHRDMARSAKSRRIMKLHNALLIALAAGIAAGAALHPYADTPLVEPTTLRRVRDALAAGSDLVVLGFRPESPAGYGRLVMNGDRVIAIREEKDATAAERAKLNCGAAAILGA